MCEIINLPVVTKLNLDPDRTLENLKGKLKGFIIAGYDIDGNEIFSSTYADGGDVLWLIERFKKVLLEVPDNFID